MNTCLNTNGNIFASSYIIFLPIDSCQSSMILLGFNIMLLILSYKGTVCSMYVSLLRFEHIEEGNKTTHILHRCYPTALLGIEKFLNISSVFPCILTLLIKAQKFNLDMSITLQNQEKKTI